MGVRIDAVSLTSDEEDEDVLAPRPVKRSMKESRRDEALIDAVENKILDTSLIELHNLESLMSDVKDEDILSPRPTKHSAKESRQPRETRLHP